MGLLDVDIQQQQPKKFYSIARWGLQAWETRRCFGRLHRDAAVEARMRCQSDRLQACSSRLPCDWCGARVRTLAQQHQPTALGEERE